MVDTLSPRNNQHALMDTEDKFDKLLEKAFQKCSTAQSEKKRSRSGKEYLNYTSSDAVSIEKLGVQAFMGILTSKNWGHFVKFRKSALSTSMHTFYHAV